MANDDHLQRRLEFIVDNQAQFTADVQQLKELHKEAEKRMTKLEDVCLRLVNSLVNLTDRVAETSVAQTHLDTKMAELAESQTHTDQKLNALIDIVMAERNGSGSA